MAITRSVEQTEIDRAPPSNGNQNARSAVLGEEKSLNPIETRSSEMKAVVFGDINFILNETIQFGANLDLIINSIKWLLGEEYSIGIGPKDPYINMITITKRQVWVVLGIVVFLLPIAVLTLGVVQWWHRRSL